MNNIMKKALSHGLALVLIIGVVAVVGVFMMGSNNSLQNTSTGYVAFNQQIKISEDKNKLETKSIYEKGCLYPEFTVGNLKDLSANTQNYCKKKSGAFACVPNKDYGKPSCPQGLQIKYLTSNKITPNNYWCTSTKPIYNGQCPLGFTGNAKDQEDSALHGHLTWSGTSNGPGEHKQEYYYVCTNDNTKKCPQGLAVDDYKSYYWCLSDKPIYSGGCIDGFKGSASESDNAKIAMPTNTNNGVVQQYGYKCVMNIFENGFNFPKNIGGGPCGNLGPITDEKAGGMFGYCCYNP